MRRRPSGLLRAVRALTALITVWCVGCSAFEPLMSAAFGKGTGMVCASGDGMTMAGVAVSSSHSPSGGGAVSQAADHAPGFDCGCMSCHAVSPAHWTIAAVIAPTPETAHADLPSLVSAEPSALRPPPDRIA